MDIAVDIGITVGPVIGYIHQYRLIHLNKEVGSFSIDICGILLFANILRLNFFIFKAYQLALFFQSLLMIVVQIFLIRVCTQYANKRVDLSYQQSAITTEEQNLFSFSLIYKFWRWRQFSTYFYVIMSFTFATFTLSLIFWSAENMYYGELVGLVALLSESILIFPQILKNYTNKSTKGLSHLLVSFNLGGDIFKLMYFLVKVQPFQFILCGVIQVILDTFVVLQIFYYKKMADDKFAKQNKSLIVQKRHKAEDVNQPQTEEQFKQIQMKNIQQIGSPQVEDDFTFQPSYVENNNDNDTQNQKVQDHIENQQTTHKSNSKSSSKRRSSNKKRTAQQQQYYSSEPQIAHLQIEQALQTSNRMRGQQQLQDQNNIEDNKLSDEIPVGKRKSMPETVHSKEVMVTD